MSDDLFSAVKAGVILRDLIAAIPGTSLINAGTNKTRANPCPLCGHKDCFTLYDDNSFKCFSCEKAGDVINFERHLNNHDSNLTAAKALADRYNINPQNNFGSGNADFGSNHQSSIQNPKSKIQNPKSHNLPAITNDRAYALRRIAADWFHANLLANPNALAYQTDQRGHSIDTLKKYCVGWYGDGVIKAIREAGFSFDDLLAVGLMRRAGKGYKPFISDKRFTYPHFANGNILHFTIKAIDKETQQPFQLWRDAADSQWVFYGQDAVNEKSLWLVEGENDRITLIERGHVPHVAAIIGNTNTPYILSWIEQNAAGKTFYLCFDPDDAGKKYTLKYGPAITNAGGTAMAVDIFKYKNDIDAALRAADDPKAIVADLIASAHPMAPPDKSNGAMDEWKFSSFEVLGDLDDESIAIWSNINRRTYTVAIKDLSLDKMHQIGGAEVAMRVVRTATESDSGLMLFRNFKRNIIIESRATQLGKLPRLGQGIHKLSAAKLLIVNGGEAYVWDGKNFFRQDHPLIERKLIHWESGKDWIDFEALKETTLKMTQETAHQAFRALADIVGQWGFSGPLDTIVMTGFILAQIVQSAWDWRPHLWLTGSQGSGKSMLTEMIEAIGGSLVLRREGNGLTEPGLRQELANNSLITIIDEFEQSKHREAIIEILRSAGRGGIITKGSASQTPISYYIRHMVLVCSIETGLIRAAEKYRYLIIETAKDAKRRPKIPGTATSAKVKIQIVAYALWAVNVAKKLIADTGPTEGFDNRFCESVAVPLSMMAASMTDPVKSLKEAMDYYLGEWTTRQDGAVLEDEVALIQDILLAKIRISEIQEGLLATNPKTAYVERTVGQMLSENDDHRLSEDYHKTLQAHGIRYIEDTGELFIHPQSVSQQLLYRTRWRGLNIRDILLRLPGATNARERLAGTQVRGILIPELSWDTGDAPKPTGEPFKEQF